MEEQLELPIQDRGIVDRLSQQERADAVNGLVEAMIAYLSELEEEKGGING